MNKNIYKTSLHSICKTLGTVVPSSLQFISKMICMDLPKLGVRVRLCLADFKCYRSKKENASLLPGANLG